jgi:hypothetical protein
MCPAKYAVTPPLKIKKVCPPDALKATDARLSRSFPNIIYTKLPTFPSRIIYCSSPKRISPPPVRDGLIFNPINNTPALILFENY